MRDKAKIEKHQIDILVSKVKADISKQKGKVVLGVFNNKIPVLLKYEGDRSLIDELNSGSSYRIHFENVEGSWSLKINGSSAIFSFYIPKELKKIIAINPAPVALLDLKQKLMSTLSVTYRFRDRATTVKLFIDSEWIENLI
ncbi:hypothetical protein ACNQKP_05110 [Bdellovibrio bacteriovorus]|uniref:hypothetical protein n=1 Tax=Bdellovibrio bacteriovorus TaxID=959 RepID=UPI003AA8CC4A